MPFSCLFKIEEVYVSPGEIACGCAVAIELSIEDLQPHSLLAHVCLNLVVLVLAI